MSRRDDREREFEEFASARTPALLRSAWLLCHDHHTAEDLVQDTLAKVYVRWHRPFAAAIDNPAAYAQTTLTRTYLSRRRRRWSGEEPRAEVGEVSQSDATARVDATLTVVEALRELAPLDRAVIVLRHLEELTVAETAQVVGLSETAVRTRASRAMQRLRAHLDDTSDDRTHEGTHHV